MATSVGIIDYGMGNLGSIQNMIKRVGGKSTVSSDPNTLKNFSHLILPGVGHFKKGMEELESRHLIPFLNNQCLQKGIRTLGICLGAQLMTQFSEEGNAAGLGWIKGKTSRFRLQAPWKIPHMGWNDVQIKKRSPLLSGLLEQNRFYFVHSYFISLEDQRDALMTCQYGVEFVAGFEKDNLAAFQFHPEKSHRFGMVLIKNFLDSQA